MDGYECSRSKPPPLHPTCTVAHRCGSMYSTEHTPYPGTPRTLAHPMPWHTPAASPTPFLPQQPHPPRSCPSSLTHPVPAPAASHTPFLPQQPHTPRSCPSSLTHPVPAPAGRRANKGEDEFQRQLQMAMQATATVPGGKAVKGVWVGESAKGVWVGEAEGRLLRGTVSHVSTHQQGWQRGTPLCLPYRL